MCGSATLAIVVSIACMIVASMIEIVIAPRLTAGAAVSPTPLTRAAPQPTRAIGPAEGCAASAAARGIADRARPQCSARAAHARGRYQEIAGDQLEPLVVAREASLAQRVDRSTSRGLVPQPAAELAARRLVGAGGGRLQGVGLYVIDREPQHQRPRERLARAWRRFAAQPVRDVAAAFADRQSAKTDPGAAVLRHPALVRIPQLRDFRLQRRGERLGR